MGPYGARLSIQSEQRPACQEADRRPRLTSSSSACGNATRARMNTPRRSPAGTRRRPNMDPRIAVDPAPGAVILSLAPARSKNGCL